MPSQHILLTGGTGFFGRALLRHWLRQAGQPVDVPAVTVLTRAPDQFLACHPEFAGHPWLHFCRGDILLPDTLPRQTQFTHILHAATDSTLGPQLTPLARYTQIVDGTRNMLDFAREQGTPRFLLTSSGGVYGQQPAHLEKIPETYNGMPDPLNPANAYSVAKRCAEHLCALYQEAYGIETVIARCFAFVGPDLPLDAHFAIGNFIRDALWKDAIHVSGDGTPLRSYMHQDDLALWLNVLLLRGRAGQAYNVGSDESISIADLAYLIRGIFAPSKPVLILAQKNIPRNVYVPNIEKTYRELELKVSIPLNQSISITGSSINKRSDR